jgi:hypothetical protein
MQSRSATISQHPPFSKRTLRHTPEFLNQLFGYFLQGASQHPDHRISGNLLTGSLENKGGMTARA